MSNPAYLSFFKTAYDSDTAANAYDYQRRRCLGFRQKNIRHLTAP